MTKADRFARLTCNAHLRSDLRGSSVRAAAFTWAAGISEAVLRLGSTAILARLVLPEQFGLVMMVTAVTAIADQFRDFGLSSATIQRKAITHEEVTNLFWINFSAGALISLVVCFCSPLITAYYKEPRLTPIACALAVNFFLGGLAVQHEALLTRQLKLGQCAVVRTVASTLSTFLAIGLAWFGFGCWALVWREVARYAMVTTGMWLCFPWIPGLPRRNTDVRELLGFGTHLVGANVLGSITGAMDRVLLGRLRGPAPVAMYRQAYQLLVMPMDQLLSPVYHVAQPGLSMLQTEPGRFRRFYKKVATIVGLATMPASAFVGIYSTEITRVLLGRRWIDSAPILTILSFGTFLKQPLGSAAYILITRGFSRSYFRLSLLQNVSFVALAYIGVHWGTRGIACADVATTYLLFAPTLYICLKDSPVALRDYLAAFTRPALASLCMAVVLFMLRQAMLSWTMPSRFVLGCLAAPATLLTAWLLLPGGKNELLILISDVQSALKRRRKEPPLAEPVAVSG